jgi:hypothetical protein
MKRTLLIAFMAACSGQAFAADFGIGLSVQSDDAWIYAPIDITPRFRIEPSIRFFNGESESQTQSPDFSSTVTTTVTSEAETRELGIGLFGLTSVGESVRVYYGARAAYIDSESKLRIVSRFMAFEDVEEEAASADGYRISPTLGFEYLINDRFSIGGEAEWFYQDVESELSRTTLNSATAESKSNGTDTRLIVRFRF